MQLDLGVLATREFLSLEANRSFGVPIESLPPHGEPATTHVVMLWTGRSGWIARASVPGHAGDCLMAGGMIPKAAFAVTTVRHKGVDPESSVCDDDTVGTGTAGWPAYVQRYTALPLEHALRFFARRQREGNPVSPDSALLPRVLVYSGLHRELLWSQSDSWGAQTWLDAFPGRSCVVWWGTLRSHTAPTTKGGSIVSEPGRVACDSVAAEGH